MPPAAPSTSDSGAAAQQEAAAVPPLQPVDNNNVLEQPEDGVSSADESSDYESASSEADSAGSGSEGEDAAELDPAAAQPVPAAAQPAPLDPVRDQGLGEHGCDHYRRRAKFVSPCCNEVFFCRHCHNAAKDENEPDTKKKHTLVRADVKELICCLCSTRQPVAETCVNCHVQFGRYSCLLCRFFSDAADKHYYHCTDCGICRVGEPNQYFHCKTCNACYAIEIKDTHVCVENSMHQNCPVCFEYLFDSTKQITVLPCGHTIHAACLRELGKNGHLSCPMCAKCYLDKESQARAWQHYDRVVAETPMPPEYRNTQVTILCNDCNKKGTTRFHVVGYKCGVCGGYNTRRV